VFGHEAEFLSGKEGGGLLNASEEKRSLAEPAAVAISFLLNHHGGR
jgi:hypothetical protein